MVFDMSHPPSLIFCNSVNLMVVSESNRSEQTMYQGLKLLNVFKTTLLPCSQCHNILKGLQLIFFNAWNPRFSSDVGDGGPRNAYVIRGDFKNTLDASCLHKTGKIRPIGDPARRMQCVVRTCSSEFYNTHKLLSISRYRFP